MADGDYCSTVPRVRLILAALLATLAVVAATAAASPLDVHQDYFDNGAIDSEHSTEDLRGALEAARGDAAYAGLATAVEGALDHALLGRTSHEGRPAAPAAVDTGLGVLPTPRAVDESGNPPWPLLVLSVLAGLLALSGAGSSIYRRLHRTR